LDSSGSGSIQGNGKEKSKGVWERGKAQAGGSSFHALRPLFNKRKGNTPRDENPGGGGDVLCLVSGNQRKKKKIGVRWKDGT